MAGEYLLDYKARKYYTGNGSQIDFLITFPGGQPLESSHVHVFVNGSELTGAWNVVVDGGNKFVRFDTPPNGASAGNVLLKRVTPSTEDTRVVDFTGGSLLKAEDLDRAQLNCLYVSQESADLFLDQGGTAVNTTFDQSIGGTKTFTGVVNVANEANLVFKPDTIPLHLIGGIQYVLAAKDSDGTVGWEETLLQTLPANVVLTDGPVEGQEILTNKKFSGQVELANSVKLPIGAAANKVLTSDNAGNAQWAVAVNGIRLGSASAPISTGTVVITPESIGVLGGVTIENGVAQVLGPVNFDSSITIGDASLDDLVIESSIQIPTNAGAGKLLTSNADGFASWSLPPTYVKSVNGKTGSVTSSTDGVVTLVAADLDAVTINGQEQVIPSPKVFTGAVTLGATNTTSPLTIGSVMKYTPGVLASGAQAGRILTSLIDGTAVWDDPPPLGIVTINQKGGQVVTLNATEVGAVDRFATESIGGTKTFTTAPIMSGGITVNTNLAYPVGSFGTNKFLTSDASGNASWATVPASGIVAVNNDYGTGGHVTITAASLNAVSTDTIQDITGAKTFKENVVLGVSVNKTVTIGAVLKYPVGLGSGGTQQEGQVLTSTADGTCVWQVPEPAGVYSLNGASGALTMDATSLGALTLSTLPVCSGQTLGAVKMGTGLYMTSGGVLNVQTGGSFPTATRFDAATPTIGGVMIGDNLLLDPTTGRLDALTGTQSSQVTSLGGLSGGVTLSDLYTLGLAGKAVSQTFTDYTNFNKTVRVNAVAPSQGGPGINNGYGINLNCEPFVAGTDNELCGCVSAQNVVSTNHVFRGYSKQGGVTYSVTGTGDAYFAGTVTAGTGFQTNGGMSIGDNLIDGITLKGTVKIPAGATTGFVLTCAGDTDTGGANTGKAVWTFLDAAPVSSVNGRVGAVTVTADEVTTGIGAVTKTTTQTITGEKTFAAVTAFSNNTTIGAGTGTTCTVNANLNIPTGGPGVGKVWTCSNNTTGAGSWVAPATIPVLSVQGRTGAVVISAADIGAVTTTGDQSISGAKAFTGAVSFSGSVSIGTTETTNLSIGSSIKIPTNAGAGKFLTCFDNTGACNWTDAAAPIITSVNNRVGAVVITADDAGTGIGAVTKDTAQTISGAKTFSASTLFDGAVTLGDGLVDDIKVLGTLKVPHNAAQGRVLTCGATGGVVAWENQLITSVATKIDNIAVPQTGEVIITAALLGAATSAELVTATAAVATAQTTANNAATAAATAQATANSKLAAVSVTTTANPVGGTQLTCLEGNGTSGSPLKVLGALPLGGITSGDLTGSYPGPTIGANKVTYNKMQQVSAQRLLGNATASTNNVTEIGLGGGLKWDGGSLNTVNNGDAVLSATQTFAGANTFSSTVQVDGTLNATSSVVMGDAYTDTLTVNATPTFKTDVTLAASKKLVTPLLQMTTNPSAGHVLTASNASGDVIWAAPASSAPSTLKNIIGSTQTVRGSPLSQPFDTFSAGTGGIKSSVGTWSGVYILYNFTFGYGAQIYNVSVTTTGTTLTNASGGYDSGTRIGVYHLTRVS